MRKYKCLKREKYVDKNIYLQSIQKNEIEKIRLWRNSQMDILRQDSKINQKQQLEYFKKNVWSQNKKIKPDKILFSIKNNEKLLGYGGLTNISWSHKRAEVSFLLDDQIVKFNKLYKKYFSEFLNLIILIAFKELKFKKLYTETYPGRRLHVSILKQNGFKLEGILKSHIYQSNKFSDSYLHGLIKK